MRIIIPYHQRAGGAQLRDPPPHRVVSIFPNEAACLRLISAILMEIDEEWQTGKVYLNVKPSS